jgi:hypothetical protein
MALALFGTSIFAYHFKGAPEAATEFYSAVLGLQNA